MLQVQKQQQYVEKIMQLPNGNWAAVIFALTEYGSKVTAKAISYRLIEAPIEEAVIALPVLSQKSNIVIEKSPYFSDIEAILKDLSFVTSQPTRGPDTI
jgi:hypothetical protein